MMFVICLYNPLQLAYTNTTTNNALLRYTSPVTKGGILEKAIEYLRNSYTTIRAFSAKWPYIACSGLKSTLLLYNAFDRKYMRCIDICKEAERMTILETFITETNDLFIVL